jgi:hypothetical protein
MSDRDGDGELFDVERTALDADASVAVAGDCSPADWPATCPSPPAGASGLGGGTCCIQNSGSSR